MNNRALRRFPLSKLMDLKVDFAFKQLFGSEKNKHITIVFLNAVLQRTGRDTIKEVIFKSQEVGGEHEDDKQSRLDILVQTQSGEHVNIEVQLANQHDMLKRTMFYWSRIYTSQLQKGMGYHKLLPTITINICNFTVFEKNPAYHSTFHLYEDSIRERLDPEDDVLEVHFIEMNKFLAQWHRDELNALDDILARWLLLLGMVDARKQRVYDDIYRELEELAKMDKNLIAAFDAWEEISQSPETKYAYESRLKFILDEEAKLDDVREMSRREGIEQGIEQGIQKGIEEGVKNVARRMIAKGNSNEDIMDVTELPEEVIEALRSE